MMATRLSRASLLAATLFLSAACSSDSDKSEESLAESAKAMAAADEATSSIAPAGERAVSERAKTTLRRLHKEMVAVVKPFVNDKKMADGIARYTEAYTELVENLGKEGVKAGRAGIRVRNKAAATPEWVKSWLKDAAQAGPEGPEGFARRDGDVIRGVQPLRAESLCLTCHGPRGQLLDDARVELEKRYPEDAAVDFAENELMGAAWVEIPMTPQ